MPFSTFHFVVILFWMRVNPLTTTTKNRDNIGSWYNIKAGISATLKREKVSWAWLRGFYGKLRNMRMKWRNNAEILFEIFRAIMTHNSSLRYPTGCFRLHHNSRHMLRIMEKSENDFCLREKDEAKKSDEKPFIDNCGLCIGNPSQWNFTRTYCWFSTYLSSLIKIEMRETKENCCSVYYHRDIFSG